MSPMNQSGRISLLALAFLASVIVVIAILTFSRESPTAAGEKFMFALITHDVDTLTKLSNIPGESDDQIRKEWDTACNVAGKYYVFDYKINGGSQPDDKNAAVRMQVIKDANKPGAYEENFQLPMVNVNGQWKVDVRGTSHDFFPAFPR